MNNLINQKLYYVYIWINMLDFKMYCGITDNLTRRKNQHKTAMVKKKNLPLPNAMNTYGYDNFAYFPIFAFYTEKEAEEKETEIIAQFKLQDTINFGYNIEKGGKRSAASQKTIENRRKAMTGKKPTEESKEKNRLSHFGNKHTDETREQMSKDRKGRPQSPEHIANRANSRRGSKLTLETKNKISESHKEVHKKRKRNKLGQWA